MPALPFRRGRQRTARHWRDRLAALHDAREFAGEVERVGAAVTDFAPGDGVFGVNATHFGAHAEFLRVARTAPVATMPPGVSFEEAAAVCDEAIIAMSCLRTARLEAGQRILVYGASGSIGTAAVQLAKDAEAEVTAVCDTRASTHCAPLGADTVLDYTREDFAVGGAIYDVVFDAVGKITFRRCRRIIRPGGVMIETDLGPALAEPLAGGAHLAAGSRRVVMPIPRYTQANVLALKYAAAHGRAELVPRTRPRSRLTPFSGCQASYDAARSSSRPAATSSTGLRPVHQRLCSCPR